MLLATIIALTSCATDQGSTPSAEAPSSGPQSLDEVRDIFSSVDFDAPPADIDTQPPAPMQTRDVTINTMADFLTFVYNENLAFWKNGFAAADMPDRPTGTAVWPGPGESVPTGCGEGTTDLTAAYCSTDDTIYVSQQFAFELWDRGCAATQCDENVAGDFSVAYVVGHEMGHNIEHELNLYELGLPTYRMELLADCMAGLWANRAYFEGLLEAGDVEEAIATANLIGDYDFLDPDHHGTPDERVSAFSLGWNSGNLNECAVYLDTSPIGS